MTCAILLAAGQSRRMGTQKLLLPYAGRPLVARVAQAILDSAVARLFVVVSAEYAEAIAGALAGKSCTLVLNPERESEMLASVRCGLRALPPECGAFLLALGDQPTITAGLIDRMIASRTAGPAIVVPTFDGKRGHPLLISSHFFAEIRTAFDDAGLRGLLAAHPTATIELATDDPDVLRDLDSPEDYARALSDIAPASDSPPDSRQAR